MEEGVIVEEDVALFAAVQRWRPSCTWAGLLTDPDRLFPCRSHDSATRPGLAVLCDEFPELFSGWPGGLLLRHLPVKNIARLSMAAKAWRHLMQDPNVWKLLCGLAWPHCRRSQVAAYGGSWRAMYIHRPRPRTDGYYVFKYSTQRFGTNEGRGMKGDAGTDFFRPVIITLMYKVLIFCSGGRVMLLTTNNETIPPDKLARHIRRSQLRLSNKKLREAAMKLGNCSISVGGVVHGQYVLDGCHINLDFTYVPEENLRMYPVQIGFRAQLASTRTAANDVLTCQSHTTGGHADTVELGVPERPFRFVPFESFSTRMEDIDGWPQCYVGGRLELTQEDALLYAQFARGDSRTRR